MLDAPLTSVLFRWPQSAAFGRTQSITSDSQRPKTVTRADMPPASVRSRPVSAPQAVSGRRSAEAWWFGSR